MQPVPGTLERGRYRVRDELGRGGMSVVHEVLDTRLGIRRAVKLMDLGSTSAAARRRFETEARTMARLHHPSIVSVFDVLYEPPFGCLVMELLEGGSLAERITSHGPMPARAALEILLPVLDAVELAHRNSVIHRDLKPANILLTADGCPKVSDFGIAHVQDPLGEAGLTRTGTQLGTWGYMAPEQRRDAREVDARSDVYSLGATLFTLLTGTTPVDLFAAHHDEALLVGVPPTCRPLVLRATHYEPALRFRSARDFGAAARALSGSLPEIEQIGGLSIRPSPPAPMPGETAVPLDRTLAMDPRARRVFRRSVLVAAGVVLATSVVGSTWLLAPRGGEAPAGTAAAVPDLADAAVVADVTPEPQPDPPVNPAPAVIHPSSSQSPSARVKLQASREAAHPVVSPAPRPVEVIPPPSEPVAAVVDPTLAEEPAEVSATGEAETLVLVDESGGRHPIGTVAAGSYTVEATFGGRPEPVIAGRITLHAGQHLTIHCQANFAKCR